MDKTRKTLEMEKYDMDKIREAAVAEYRNHNIAVLMTLMRPYYNPHISVDFEITASSSLKLNGNIFFDHDTTAELDNFNDDWSDVIDLFGEDSILNEMMIETYDEAEGREHKWVTFERLNQFMTRAAFEASPIMKNIVESAIQELEGLMSNSKSFDQIAKETQHVIDEVYGPKIADLVGTGDKREAFLRGVIEKTLDIIEDECDDDDMDRFLDFEDDDDDEDDDD